MALTCPDVGNGLLSPRISFAFYLSHTDGSSPKNPKEEEDLADVNYNAEFEFCTVRDVNGGASGEALSSAEELFVDGKILAQDQAVDAQQISTARHLENSRRPSPDRTPSCPKISGSKNIAVSKPCPKPKEAFELSHGKHSCKETENKNDFKWISPPSSRSWPFSPSRSTGGEPNDIARSLPFTRSASAGERKPKRGFGSWWRSKSLGAQPTFKENEILFAGLKPPAGCRFEPPYPEIGKPKGGGGPGMAGGPRGFLYSPGRNYGGGSNVRSAVRNPERCGSKAFASPRPGRSEGLMSSGSKSYGSTGGEGPRIRVSPVLNVLTCMGADDSWNGSSSSLFGFCRCFSSKNPCSRRSSSANRKKGA